MNIRLEVASRMALIVMCTIVTVAAGMVVFRASQFPLAEAREIVISAKTTTAELQTFVLENRGHFSDVATNVDTIAEELKTNAERIKNLAIIAGSTEGKENSSLLEFGARICMLLDSTFQTTDAEPAYQVGLLETRVGGTLGSKSTVAPASLMPYGTWRKMEGVGISRNIGLTIIKTEPDFLKALTIKIRSGDNRWVIVPRGTEAEKIVDLEETGGELSGPFYLSQWLELNDSDSKEFLKQVTLE